VKRFMTVIVSALMCHLAGLAMAQQPPVSITVTVDISKPGPEIDRNIYGQFAEHLGRGIYDGIWVGKNSSIPNLRGYRRDVVEALRKLHVPVIRWPGGCFADQYDWRDGIGPSATRPVRINSRWGGVPEDNAFGTHEFLDFAELIGADAYVSGNMGSMSPMNMAQWLEYMTSADGSSLAQERRRNGRDKPWQIKYFGLGNELFGCGGDMRAEYAADVTRRYSTYVNVPPDKTLMKVAGGPDPNFGSPDYKAFADTMMANAKGAFGRLNFQALSFHYYADYVVNPADDPKLPVNKRATGFAERDWSVALRAAQQMERGIATMSEIMDRYDPEKKVALFVDEWGTWHEPEPGTNPHFLFQQNSLLDAEVAALTLNIFHRHTDRVKMANIAQMINVLQAMILTDGDKMLLTPTYHIFEMYMPFQSAMPYPAAVSGPQYTLGGHSIPTVDVSAARGKDGRLYLAVVNVDPHRSAEVTTNLNGRATGRILTGPEMDSHNTFEAPESIHPLPFSSTNREGRAVAFVLPAKSIAVVMIE
jgi:alpha-L-arabinofuranosidase